MTRPTAAASRQRDQTRREESPETQQPAHFSSHITLDRADRTPDGHSRSPCERSAYRGLPFRGEQERKVLGSATASRDSPECGDGGRGVLRSGSVDALEWAGQTEKATAGREPSVRTSPSKHRLTSDALRPARAGLRLLLRPLPARPERFELPTFGSVDRRSIQLSYGRQRASLVGWRSADRPRRARPRLGPSLSRHRGSAFGRDRGPRSRGASPGARPLRRRPVNRRRPLSAVYRFRAQVRKSSRFIAAMARSLKALLSRVIESSAVWLLARMAARIFGTSATSLRAWATASL